MTQSGFEPLQLDLDWEPAPGESQRHPILPPRAVPTSPQPVEDDEPEPPEWGLEWIEDIEEEPGQFLEEPVTAAETPDSKRPTLRAAPPPPGGESSASVSVSLPPTSSDGSALPLPRRSGLQYPYRSVVTPRQALAYLRSVRSRSA